jgi:hypothetical protein
VVTGEMKSWMKWKIYAQRILDYFEMAEPDKRFTVAMVSRELQIPRPETQNAMLRMTMGNDAVLGRMKFRGNSYTYALLKKNGLDVSDGDSASEAEPPSTVEGIIPSTNRIKNVAPKDDDLDEYGIPKGW